MNKEREEGKYGTCCSQFTFYLLKSIYHKADYISPGTKSCSFYHILENTSLLVQSHSPEGPIFLPAALRCRMLHV